MPKKNTQTPHNGHPVKRLSTHVTSRVRSTSPKRHYHQKLYSPQQCSTCYMSSWTEGSATLQVARPVHTRVEETTSSAKEIHKSIAAYRVANTYQCHCMWNKPCHEITIFSTGDVHYGIGLGTHQLKVDIAKCQCDVYLA